MRIHIIGASGSGKTTLGYELASRLHIHHYELDRAEEIQTDADLLTLAEQPDWITEGIYLIWTEPLLYHADCIVLLEVSWPVAAWRILRRHIWNSLRGQQRYPGINGMKSLVKLLKDNRRYILNLDGRDPLLAEKLARCIETHQAMNEPLTEDSLKAYYETYKELSEPPAEEFVQFYLEKYQEKLYLIRNEAERERFLTFATQKG